ncbi:uncharacterized protein ACA1_198110 [Acanthamoeba castellanii str. Neff]|uniref:Uncharacterized protein n=1 Tax=Acanthamoeba castellanii (strain ATCC 30010 / Neff) TaxID=1257118 RepID=L8H594_ACACF|nr:uncharacterized protein ACA1_198110 [Acanthamoeba castellanii str. Neff]ELR19601.1 hypothetical protein ACA1_198110 [Acanthamoeba castellanii str. Neff]
MMSASDASPQVSSSGPSSLTTHPGLQDETEFELVTGWADSWTETVSVLPSDTLERLFAVTNARPHCLAEVRVAPSVETRRLKLHTRLPHPRPDATLAENGLKQGHVLRWTPGARKD